VLRDRLGELEDRFFATVFLGSGLLFLAMLFASAAVAGGIIAAYGARPEGLLDSATFTFARAVTYEIMNLYAVKMAAVFRDLYVHTHDPHRFHPALCRTLPCGIDHAGALANNQWSLAGWGKKSVDALLVQPFVNYNFPHGWYVTSAPIITANWAAASDERWTVPIGGGVGKIIKIDKLPINTSLQAFCNVVTPQHSGADWQLRFQVQFLFPK